MILLLLALLIALYPLLCFLNFRHNSALDSDPASTTENALFNGQNTDRCRPFRFGLYPASRNSCEAIALHNLRVLCGMPSSLSRAICDIQKSVAMLGYGFLGTNPFALGRVMRHHGFKVVQIGVEDMSEAGLYIFSFWTKRPWLSPAHTVAVSRRGNRLIAYNLTGLGNASELKPENYSGRILCVYKIEKP